MANDAELERLTIEQSRAQRLAAQRLAQRPPVSRSDLIAFTIAIAVILAVALTVIGMLLADAQRGGGL